MFTVYYVSLHKYALCRVIVYGVFGLSEYFTATVHTRLEIVSFLCPHYCARIRTAVAKNVSRKRYQ